MLLSVTDLTAELGLQIRSAHLTSTQTRQYLTPTRPHSGSTGTCRRRFPSFSSSSFSHSSTSSHPRSSPNSTPSVRRLTQIIFLHKKIVSFQRVLFKCILRFNYYVLVSMKQKFKNKTIQINLSICPLTLTGACLSVQARCL